MREKRGSFMQDTYDYSVSRFVLTALGYRGPSWPSWPKYSRENRFGFIRTATVFSVTRRIKKHLCPVVSVSVQKCSMCRDKAVVVLLVFVHTTATTQGWRLNLLRRRRLRATAGALAFSQVNETLMTPLLWSEISKSFNPSFWPARNKNLKRAVLGLGKKKEAEMFPMSMIKLWGYSSRVSSL